MNAIENLKSELLAAALLDYACDFDNTEIEGLCDLLHADIRIDGGFSFCSCQPADYIIDIELVEDFVAIIPADRFAH